MCTFRDFYTLCMSKQAWFRPVSVPGLTFTEKFKIVFLVPWLSPWNSEA